jgi:RNA polymerase sigma factor (TIGR02999 family)
LSDTDPNAVTKLLAEIEGGDASAADRLLPLVYAELRHLARSKLAREPAGMTLQPTALVHEAYLRLLGESGAVWKGKAHFFAAAATAMRRILIERARQRRRIKHGGELRRIELTDDAAIDQPETLDLEALDEALTRLERFDTRLGDVVSLRFFAGLSVEETAEAMGSSPRTVKRDWNFARAWLHRELSATTGQDGGSTSGGGVQA